MMWFPELIEETKLVSLFENGALASAAKDVEALIEELIQRL